MSKAEPKPTESPNAAPADQWIPTKEELDIMYGPGVVHHGPFSEEDDEDL